MELKSYHGYGNGQGDIWKIGDTFLIDLLRCSVLWFPAINQNPLSRSGLKNESRKSRDIQSLSQRQCELKCADSRAVTKRGLFDCEPATRQIGWYSGTKPLFAQWTKNVKCNIRISSHLWQSVNENKCITKVRVPTKVIDENLWNPRRLRVSSVNKTAQAVVLPSFMGMAYEVSGI